MAEYRDLDNPLKLEIEKRMQKNCDSGSFRITKGLVDMAGSVGNVVNAIYARAIEIDAEFSIVVEKGVRYRISDTGAYGALMPSIVEWSR